MRTAGPALAGSAAAGGGDAREDAAAFRAVPAGAPAAGLRPGRTPGAQFEIATGTPAEHRLGDQHAQTALEMAQLFRGGTAVAALREMLLDIRQQGSAAANRNVEEPVVEAAILRRREFPMGMYTSFPEFFTRLFERRRRGVGGHAEECGGHDNRLRLHLGVPQQASGESGKGLE